MSKQNPAGNKKRQAFAAKTKAERSRALLAAKTKASPAPAAAPVAKAGEEQ